MGLAAHILLEVKKGSWSILHKVSAGIHPEGGQIIQTTGRLRAEEGMTTSTTEGDDRMTEVSNNPILERSGLMC